MGPIFLLQHLSYLYHRHLTFWYSSFILHWQETDESDDELDAHSNSESEVVVTEVRPTLATQVIKVGPIELNMTRMWYGRC